MGDFDGLLGTVSAVHAAGLDAELWPAALAAATELIGGMAGTFEVTDRRTFATVFFQAHCIPSPEELAYVSHYAQQNPRLIAALEQKPGELAWDYQILDEREIDHSPFYAGFLAPLGMRYAVAGIVDTPADEFSAFAIQRSAKQGHVDQRELDLMRRLLPHVGQALAVNRKLRAVTGRAELLEHALDWLADGLAMLDAEGAILYANQALRRIADERDGIELARGRIGFATAAARRSLDEALAAVGSLRAGDSHAPARDFVAHRRSDLPAYLVSVRPVLSNGKREGDAAVLLFVHDPACAERPEAKRLSQIFGFTAAEAHLAVALAGGEAPAVYAARQGLSPNTIYTHLRRIKDKTGCRRTVELVALLGSIRAPAIGP